ncbi:uncharacterized protein LOC113307536 [Papaver somniferum]|uniref:uncharacterized protein LOC113307536 n=1 Tax=Papaver somniferum TaxID=3469 RepID=UPI000E6FC153|nr:uncharacterized protein LOC113307536 [Papaver somniferum]
MVHTFKGWLDSWTPDFDGFYLKDGRDNAFVWLTVRCHIISALSTGPAMLLPRHERTATVGVFGKSALSEIKNVCDTSKSSMRDWMVNPRFREHWSTLVTRNGSFCSLSFSEVFGKIHHYFNSEGISYLVVRETLFSAMFLSAESLANAKATPLELFQYSDVTEKFTLKHRSFEAVEKYLNSTLPDFTDDDFELIKGWKASLRKCIAELTHYGWCTVQIFTLYHVYCQVYVQSAGD